MVVKVGLKEFEDIRSGRLKEYSVMINEQNEHSLLQENSMGSIIRNGAHVYAKPFESITFECLGSRIEKKLTETFVAFVKKGDTFLYCVMHDEERYLLKVVFRWI